MDCWAIYLQLNLQEHWYQNIWKGLLIIGSKMGAGPAKCRCDLTNGITLKIYHHVNAKYLQEYLDEFAFRWSH